MMLVARPQGFRRDFVLAPRRDAAGFLAALARLAFFAFRPTFAFLDVFLLDVFLAALPGFAFFAALDVFLGDLPVFFGVLPALGLAAGAGLFGAASGDAPGSVFCGGIGPFIQNASSCARPPPGFHPSSDL